MPLWPQRLFVVSLLLGVVFAIERFRNVFPVNEPVDAWSGVDQAIQTALQNKAFPGCVAIVGSPKGFLYAKAWGNFTYGIPPPYNGNTVPPMALDTLFDLASLSKIVGATTAIAQFYQRGEINLHEPISQFLGPAYNANGKAAITILNCLLHNAGYPPDPSPIYASPQFGCPATSQYYVPEVFTCQEKIFQSLLNQTLINPVGAKYVYSDLSMITLMYVVGNLARTLGYITPADLRSDCASTNASVGAKDQCYFEAYVRKFVWSALEMTDTGFLPPQSVWGKAAPTFNDTTWRHKVIQGQVEDPNSYALGGIAGHAGVFSSALDLATFMARWMYPSQGGSGFLNSSTVSFFIKEYNHSQSSRALGWNTNDPTVFDEGWNQSCGSLSPTTFMHTGYTGTELCGDPVRQIYTVFLTNRMYPNDTVWLIEHVRQLFNTAVQQAVDALYPLDDVLDYGTPPVSKMR